MYSQAAAPTTSIESEAGTLSGGATQITDVSASAGKAVRFASSPLTTRECPPFPAFPDETCTGVPVGYPLQTYTGDFTTTSDGQAIDGLYITGKLVVNNENVTVTNSHIVGRINLNGHKGLDLTDVEVGPDTCPASSSTFQQLTGSGYTLTRTYFHNSAADAIRLSGSGKTIIQDSLIKNACYYTGDHLDTIQWYSPGTTGDVTITHSNIDVRPANYAGNGNAAVFWSDVPGDGSQLTLHNNLFAGGNYTIYINDAPAGSNSVITVTDNRWVDGSYNYGPRNKSNTIAYDGTSGVIWSGNSFVSGAEISY